MKCAIIKIDRGKDVKKHHLVKNGAMPLFYDLRRMLVGWGNYPTGGLPFFFEKGIPVSKKLVGRKSSRKMPKLLPIVVVPDKSYIDDTGHLIDTDVILVSDLEMYRKMNAILGAWGKEPMGVPGQRGIIIG